VGHGAQAPSEGGLLARTPPSHGLGGVALELPARCPDLLAHVFLEGVEEVLLALVVALTGAREGSLTTLALHQQGTLLLAMLCKGGLHAV